MCAHSILCVIPSINELIHCPAGAQAHEIEPASVPDNPSAFFERWLGEAVASPLVKEAGAMQLCTVDPQTLQPSTRVVLLRSFADEKLTFFTSYTSRKGAELDANPRAAVCFYWDRLER